MHWSMKRLDDVSGKKEKTAIGLMSGTSVDGIDAVLLTISGCGLNTRITERAFITVPYSQEVRQRLLALASGSFGGRGYTQTLFNDPVISRIAKEHGKTSAQVILRWHIQAGNIAIPGSSNEQHIIEDAHIWDFSLTAAEMENIAKLDKNKRNSTY